MFGKIFGSKKRDAIKPKASHPAEEAMARAIAEKKKEDPLIGVKIGSKSFLDQLLNAMKNERGVHIESLLALLGSVGGFACQMSVRAQQSAPAFVVFEGADGHKYFFGDLINYPLAEAPLSLYGIAGGGAQTAGATTFPDLKELFEYVTKSAGTPAFGIPRVPDAHKPSDMPINYVRSIWPKMPQILAQHCDSPDQWPIFFGLAIQQAIIMGKSAIDPQLALQIVMECAIPMSKINPAEYLSQT